MLESLQTADFVDQLIETTHEDNEALNCRRKTPNTQRCAAGAG